METLANYNVNRIPTKSKVLDKLNKIRWVTLYKGETIKESSLKKTLSYLVDKNVKYRSRWINLTNSFRDYKLICKLDEESTPHYDVYKKNKNWTSLHLFTLDILVNNSNWNYVVFIHEDEPDMGESFFNDTWINNYCLSNYINNNK